MNDLSSSELTLDLSRVDQDLDQLQLVGGEWTGGLLARDELSFSAIAFSLKPQ